MSYQQRNQLLEIIQEYKSDNAALKKQIEDMKKQLDDAEARIKRLLIRFEQFEYDNKETK
jgi:septal ring factor EnvC (AmiA/AmiB activator)|tara:strand:- start:353 stop:532 length:180 start_codon:yes stop_codon:yes gene_type:complete